MRRVLYRIASHYIASFPFPIEGSTEEKNTQKNKKHAKKRTRYTLVYGGEELGDLLLVCLVRRVDVHELLFFEVRLPVLSKTARPPPTREICRPPPKQQERGVAFLRFRKRIARRTYQVRSSCVTGKRSIQGISINSQATHLTRTRTKPDNGSPPLPLPLLPFCFTT